MDGAASDLGVRCFGFGFVGILAVAATPPVATTLSGGTNTRRMEFLVTAVGVRVVAGDDDDIAMIEVSVVFTFWKLAPREARFAAHVVIDQRAPVGALRRVVGQGTMEQIAVKENHGAWFHLDGDGLFVPVGEID